MDSGVNLSIDGSVENTSSENGSAMYVNVVNNSHAKVSIGGDVTTEREGGIGLSLNVADYPSYSETANSTIDVHVAGTIRGKEVGVNIGSGVINVDLGMNIGPGVTTDNVTLTVWQIELNDAGHAVESSNYQYDPETQTSTRKAVYEEKEQEFEQSILYIIKIEQPSEGAVNESRSKGFVDLLSGVCPLGDCPLLS